MNIAKGPIKTRWLAMMFVAIALFIVLTIISAALFTVSFEKKHADRYYPGVMIAGESVGGKTYQDVLREFKIKSDFIIKNGLALTFISEKRTRDVRIPVFSSGLTSDTLVEYFSLGDWEETLKSAFAWGRNGPYLNRFKEQLSSSLNGKDFDFPLFPHEEAIESLLLRETKNLLSSGTPAQFSFSGNRVVITPEKPGQNIDLEKVVDIAAEGLKALRVNPIVFRLQPESPFITKERLEPYFGLAEELAKSANINFRYERRKWKVGGPTLVTWLTLGADGGLKIDSNKLVAYLSKSVVPLIDDPPKNSRFEMKEGKLIEILPGKAGNVVDIQKTVEKIEKIIPYAQKSFNATASIYSAFVAIGGDIKFSEISKTIDIPIETVRVEPTVTKATIEQYQIKDLVGYARTNFSGGSKDRQRNIEVGASKLTGILIAPGEEFSTVNALGDVTEEEGFVKEFVIKDDQTIKELGGGLCQLSTTLFRAAINAGLPIAERKNHRYVISYYGPGLDATIYGPHPDLRFVNDTGNYLLLQGKTKNNEAIFELYGVSDSRKVEISLPVLSEEKPAPPDRDIITLDIPKGTKQCVSIAHKGITADVTYKVEYLDGRTAEQVFNSVYEPWPKTCLVNPVTQL